MPEPVVKADERMFLQAVSRIRRGDCVRDLIDRLDIHHKRAWYLLGKWGRKGWYTFGVTFDLGWLTPAGMAAALECEQGAETS